MADRAKEEVTGKKGGTYYYIFNKYRKLILSQSIKTQENTRKLEVL